jgi:hypothetical protein
MGVCARACALDQSNLGSLLSRYTAESHGRLEPISGLRRQDSVS